MRVVGAKLQGAEGDLARVTEPEERIEKFSVDAKLLRELGERLVGRPHIALGELVKNSFDADARVVTITFSKDRIEVVDDGHGMSPDDFTRRWLRIGTTQKESERVSPELGRSLTGSKGVGRLSSQVLAGDLILTSVGLVNPTLHGSSARRKAAPSQLRDGIRARIRWEDAIEAGDLTQVEVRVSTPPAGVPMADGSHCGTRVVLSRLHHAWNAKRFRLLAEQVWNLQPPFGVTDDEAFTITLNSKYERVVEKFNDQMQAIFEIWTARISGSLRPLQDDSSDYFTLPPALPVRGTSEEKADRELDLDAEPAESPEPSEASADGSPPNVDKEFKAPVDRLLDVTVQFRDGASRTCTYSVPACRVHEAEFEIRVFNLQNRQPEGVGVAQARTYLDRWGGVGIYDGTFRLPYYGPEQDWLDVDAVHAARLTSSALVPDELQATRGMQNLPSNRRLFGQVRVSTTREHAAAHDDGEDPRKALAVQVTRDRLVDNDGYQQLRVLVRSGLDLYAMEQARERIEESRSRRRKANEPLPSSSFKELDEVIAAAKDTLPAHVFTELAAATAEATRAAVAIEESARANGSLLGALATAGITSIAYEHEVSKQLKSLELIDRELSEIVDDLNGRAQRIVQEARAELQRWVKRAEDIRKIFAPLTDEEDRKVERRFAAVEIAADVADHLKVLATAEINTDAVPEALHLPRGTYAAWSAVFQNLYVNAFNAIRQESGQLVQVDGGGEDASGWIRLQDRGIGIDLLEAERYFRPFERGPVRRRGNTLLGGTGLGLTIVRMITEELRCNVRFATPQTGFSTAVVIDWKGAR